MEIFRIQDGGLQRRKGVLLVRWCLWFFLSATTYFIVETVWPGDRRSVSERLAQALLTSAMLCFFSFSRVLQPPRPERITIDEDVIVVKMKGTFKKMLFADIRTAVETEGNVFRDGGLMLSEKTALRTRLLGGGIWIPKDSPDYAALKAVVDLRARNAR